MVKRYTGNIIFLLASVGLVSQVAWAQETVDYNHGSLSCPWYEAEYERIIKENENPHQPDMSTLNMLKWVTLPFFWAESLLGVDYEPPKATPIGGTVVMSGDIDDLTGAASRKNCFDLVERIGNDQSSGNHDNFKPAPIKSLLDS